MLRRKIEEMKKFRREYRLIKIKVVPKVKKSNEEREELIPNEW